MIFPCTGGKTEIVSLPNEITLDITNPILLQQNEPNNSYQAPKKAGN
jgi:hypothetical protein